MNIVLTKPDFFPGEAEQIVQLLHRDNVDLIHLRKPGCTREELEKLILAIALELHCKLVLHDHYDLALKYHLHGIHQNSRNPKIPSWAINGKEEGQWTPTVSRSCHSLEEVQAWKPKYDYVSLSPIFDSISKVGYLSAFTPAQLIQAHDQGIIDQKVLALGGVTFARIPRILSLGFGGAMILGDAW